MKKDKLTFLLIHPEISRTKYNFVGIIENECLELEYISAFLKQKGHAVFLYDGQVERCGVPCALRKYQPDVVYVCGRTRQENFMLEYCRDAKAYRREVVTIIGGLHAQLCYERMYREEVDYILTSFDIFKLEDILADAFCEEKTDISRVDGVCYRENGVWTSNKAEPFDINRLPLPDRSYFYAHPQNYRYLELTHAAWVRTAYSCPYRCRFCERNRMNSGIYSRRDIGSVVDEIAEISAENIYIVDDDFLYDEERLRKFLFLLKEKGIQKKFICYGRADFIATHEELLEELSKAGLYYVLVGLEAIRDDYLQGYQKRSDVQNNIKSIQICNRLGIHLMGMFIADIDFTPKDFRNLYRWTREQNLRHIAISIFTPEMGLETYDEYKDRMITDDASHFDYLHLVAKPSKMSVKRYYFHYYILVIRLFLRAKREGVYDFIDYGDYIRSIIKNIFFGVHEEKENE